MVTNLFGGQGNSKRRCWYMHFNKSSLVPHPQLKYSNKFDNVNSIVVTHGLNPLHNFALLNSRNVLLGEHQ